MIEKKKKNSSKKRKVQHREFYVNPNNYTMYSISLKCMFLANIKVFVDMPVGLPREVSPSQE